MKQTAIDWLFIQLYEKFEMKGNGKEMNDIFQQAKEMEKEQIIYAYWAGLEGPINDYSQAKKVGSEMIGIRFGKGAEQYYNETYNK